MSGREKRERLCGLAALVLRHQSAELAKAAQRLDRLTQQIERLEMFPSEDILSDMAFAQRNYPYETWATRRRAALYLQRELSQIDWEEEHRKASRALARLRLLERLRKG